MNAELKRWIKETEAKAAEANAKAAIMLEAAKRAREGEDPREFVLYFGKPLDYLTSWTDIRTSTYTLKPKPKLRPWTAKEWGVRIGDEFLICGRKSVLKTVNPSCLMFDTGDGCITIFTANKSDMETITQLDGSPCGEWSE